MTFAVEPAYRRFVAIVGCSEKRAGPFQVRLDNRVATAIEVLDELDPAVQIDVDIPAGTKQLTLEVDRAWGSPGIAVWADAGFVVR